jgi:3-keto-disaccharide hydrolase
MSTTTQVTFGAGLSPSLAIRVGAVVALCVTASAVDAAELAKRQVLIGQGMAGWRADHGDWVNGGEAKLSRSAPKLLEAAEGSGVLVNGETGRTENLYTSAEHGDVVAHVEFMVPQGSNSGVYFQGRYEIQVLDSWRVEKLKHGDCGGIYQRWADGKGFEGHPPRINASRPPGAWQSFDVVFRAPRFDASGKKVANAKFVKVVHNGVVVHENVEVTGPTRAAGFSDEKPTGPLMLQGDHGPVAYRNMWIEPLGQ